jgi:hypothetical protein
VVQTSTDHGIRDAARRMSGLCRGSEPPASRVAARARRAATRQRRRAWLRIFVVRCGLPCDPPVGGHSCGRGMIPRFHGAVSRQLSPSCARRERPRGRAAERSYHFPPSDSDRHVALPSKGCLVKGTISHRKRAVFTRSRAAGCRCAARAATVGWAFTGRDRRIPSLG